MSFVLSMFPTKIGEGIGKYSAIDIFISEHTIARIVLLIIGFTFALYIRIIPWGLLLYLLILYIENKADKNKG
jgi:hypothetical protein